VNLRRRNVPWRAEGLVAVMENVELGQLSDVVNPLLFSWKDSATAAPILRLPGVRQLETKAVVIFQQRKFVMVAVVPGTLARAFAMEPAAMGRAVGRTNAVSTDNALIPVIRSARNTLRAKIPWIAVQTEKKLPVLAFKLFVRRCVATKPKENAVMKDHAPATANTAAVRKDFAVRAVRAESVQHQHPNRRLHPLQSRLQHRPLWCVIVALFPILFMQPLKTPDLSGGRNLSLPGHTHYIDRELDIRGPMAEHG